MFGGSPSQRTRAEQSSLQFIAERPQIAKETCNPAMVHTFRVTCFPCDRAVSARPVIVDEGPCRITISLRPCKRRCIVRAEERERGSGDSPEKLFQRELQRRGISGTEQSDSPGGKASTSQKDPPPRITPEQLRSQLEESRKLNSEGLEGLLPRAKQLAALGGTFFLAFVPVILAISLLFSGIFWLYGENFIHGGKPTHTPPIDPAELLNEPTVDPRIPF